MGQNTSSPTTLFSFNGTDGNEPYGLIADAAGDLFGTTYQGGAYGDGTVFELAKTGTGYATTPSTLFSFNGTDGSLPVAALIADAAGDLLGTATFGGPGSDGTVFELTGTEFQVTAPAPVLSGGGNSVNYTPGGAAVAVDAELGVSDTESPALAGATVAISAGFLAGDTLNFTNQNGIVGSYNGNTGVLTLNGTASLANYQAALDSVTYSSTMVNPSDSGADSSRTVSWTVTDGTLSSNTIASTIAVAPLPPERVTYSGSGLVFVNTYDDTVSWSYRSAIITAENYLQSKITTSVTLNEKFGTASDPGPLGFVGQNIPNTMPISYAKLKQALTSNPTSSDDLAAVSALDKIDPPDGASFYITYDLAKAFTAGDPSLDLLSPTDAGLDGTVNLNSASDHSYFYNQIRVAGEYDAVSTLEHEISEEMGRLGGLGLGYPFGTAWGPMDLFRYSSLGQPDYGTSTDYFSVNGTNLLTQFNNPFQVKGDAADWNPSPEVQLATPVPDAINEYDSFGAAPTGELGIVTQTDLRVMDILGWTMTTPYSGPTVNAQSFSASANQPVAISSYFSVSDPSGDSITEYAFYDAGSNGHFSLGGTPQPNGQYVDVSAANLSSVQYVGGSAAGSETLSVAVYDATTATWSSSSSLTATTTPTPPLTPTGTTADMILRDAANGIYEIYDIGKNAILTAGTLLQAGTEWLVAGLGGFFGTDTSDMILRDSSSGALQVYDTSNNAITSAASLGQVGLEWQVVVRVGNPCRFKSEVQQDRIDGMAE